MDSDFLQPEDYFFAGTRRVVRLMQSLGVPVEVAFCLKLAGSGKWRTFLAVPWVDQQGPRPTYLQIYEAMQQHGIPRADVDFQLVGVSDSLTTTALEALKRTEWERPEAGPNVGASLIVNTSDFGGLEVEAPVFIYRARPQLATT